MSRHYTGSDQWPSNWPLGDNGSVSRGVFMGLCPVTLEVQNNGGKPGMTPRHLSKFTPGDWPLQAIVHITQKTRLNTGRSWKHCKKISKPGPKVSVYLSLSLSLSPCLSSLTFSVLSRALLYLAEQKSEFLRPNAASCARPKNFEHYNVHGEGNFSFLIKFWLLLRCIF